MKRYTDLNILYKDTDSFKYNIYTDYVFEDMKEILNYFDTSKYSKYRLYQNKM